MFPTNILLCAGFLTAYLSIYVSAIMSVSMWYIHFEMSVFNKKKKKREEKDLIFATFF